MPTKIRNKMDMPTLMINKKKKGSMNIGEQNNNFDN